MASLNHGSTGVEGILCPGRGAKDIGHGMTSGKPGMTSRQARRWVKKLNTKDSKTTRKPANGFG